MIPIESNMALLDINPWDFRWIPQVKREISAGVKGQGPKMVV